MKPVYCRSQLRYLLHKVTHAVGDEVDWEVGWHEGHSGEDNREADITEQRLEGISDDSLRTADAPWGISWQGNRKEQVRQHRPTRTTC
jgi:hypothetical protein